MQKLRSRTRVVWVLLACFLGGLIFFLYEYGTDGEAWAAHPGNPHVYDARGSMALGRVYDAGGILLVDLRNGRSYCSNALARSAMVHWTGDPRGNIQPAFLRQYADELIDYDPLNGLYQYGGAGGELSLTLSAGAQMAALQALGERKGTVAVYNYRTGQVLCAVSAPAFDPLKPPDLEADSAEQYTGMYWNRFLQSAYTPGSIFKIVTTAAALETLEDMENRHFSCTGRLELGADAVTCETPHGTITMQEALMHSCNCIYGQIGLLLGGRTMETCVAQFQITEPIRFDGITTARGHYRGAQTAGAALAWSAVGQDEDLVNPCAFLTFVGAIANGGQGVVPYVVESIRADGMQKYQGQTVINQRIMSAKTAETLQSYMRYNVVEKYGADHFDGLTVCAKSGTAQKDGHAQPDALFVGYAADSAYPLAFFAVVEEAGYGAAVCVPILSQVLHACKEAMDHGA